MQLNILSVNITNSKNEKMLGRYAVKSSPTLLLQQNCKRIAQLELSTNTLELEL